jgi:hypothetical protein
VEVAPELPKARKSLKTASNEPPIAHRGQVSDPKPQQDQAPALGASVQGEAEGVRRTTVRFTGFRVHPLDPDNFAGSVKDLLDGLRHASIISGDEPWRIRLETEQVKVAHFADERTEIEIVA